MLEVEGLQLGLPLNAIHKACRVPACVKLAPACPIHVHVEFYRGRTYLRKGYHQRCNCHCYMPCDGPKLIQAICLVSDLKGIHLP